MASSPSPARFRPMPLPELLDELFRVYRRYFSLIVGVSLVVAVPGLIWELITGTYKLSASTFTNFFPTAGTTTVPAFTNSQVGLLALGGLGGLVLLPFSIGAVFRAVTDVELGRNVSITDVLRETLARYFPLLGFAALVFAFAIVWVIASFIGFVLLVLPGLAVQCAALYFGVRWSLSVAAMMAEDIGPIAGPQRSWSLVSGMWWRCFGILLVVGILQGVISLALTIFFQLIVGFGLSGDLRLAVSAVGSTLLSAVVSPIFTIGVVLLYFDLRTRKEGLDLDQLARQTSPGPSPA